MEQNQRAIDTLARYIIYGTAAYETPQKDKDQEQVTA